MTPDDLHALFEKHEDEFLQWERIVPPLTTRRDLHAFLLLDRLVSNVGRDMVSAAEHDQIWLDVSPEDLAAVVTEEQVIELRRCGVIYDTDIGSLSLFV